MTDDSSKDTRRRRGRESPDVKDSNLSETAFSEALQSIREAKAAAVQVSGITIVVVATVVGLAVANEIWGLWVLAVGASLTCVFTWYVFRHSVEPLYLLVERIEADSDHPDGHKVGPPMRAGHEIASKAVIWLAGAFAASQVFMAGYTAVVLDWTFAGDGPSARDVVSVDQSELTND